MSWPYFADLGKDAMDIFTSAYNTGSFKLGVKSKTSTDVEISSSIATNLDTYNVSGYLQTKYETECGTLALKLDTENKFSTEITTTDFIYQGTKLSAGCSYAALEGYKFSHVKSSYFNDICSLSVDLDTNVGNPTLIASAVAGCCCWLSGIHALFDLKEKKMIGNSVAIGYLADDFVFHCACSNANELNGSVYHKVNSNLDVGIQISASSERNEAELGLGCKYKINPESTIYAKSNSSGQFGIGYQQKLHKGINFYLSTLLNVDAFSLRECKLGLALDIQL